MNWSFLALVLIVIDLAIAQNDISDFASWRNEKAAEFHSEGLRLASSNMYHESLGYFRSACRLMNSSSLFWNDLGVTEMRLHLYSKAKSRFRLALSIDPHYVVAEENLNELKKYMGKIEYNMGLKENYYREHNLNEVREVNPNDFMSQSISMEDLFDRPFVIRQAALHWGWNLSYFSLSNLVVRYGDTIVDYYPQNMLEEKAHPFFTSLRHAVDQLEYPSEIFPTVDISLPGTYIQWNMNATIWKEFFEDHSDSQWENDSLNDMPDGQDVPSDTSTIEEYCSTKNFSSPLLKLPPSFRDSNWMTSCFPTSSKASYFQLKTHWKMLLIGSESAGMFNHQDTLLAPSWQVQVEGAKKWHLCSPQDGKYLYGPGQIDTFRPDYERFPHFRKVKQCSEVILEAGDAIYYPSGYWHQTMNLRTPSISISSSIVTSSSYEIVQRELEQECAGSNRIFASEPDFCQQLQHCFQQWKELFTSL